MSAIFTVGSGKMLPQRKRKRDLEEKCTTKRSA